MQTKSTGLTVCAAIAGATLSIAMFSTVALAVDQIQDHGKTCKDIRHSPAALSTEDLVFFLAVMVVSMIPSVALMLKCNATWRAALAAVFGVGSMFVCSMVLAVTALGTSCWGNM